MLGFVAMKIHRFRSKSPALLERRAAILDLIALSELTLSDQEIEAYLTGPNDVLLAEEDGRLLALCVGTHRSTEALRFLGFLLVVVHPSARRRGLLGRLTTRYVIGELPRIALRTLTSPRRPYVAFADVCNPVSYRRLAFAPRVLPDLLRGNTTAELAEARQLRGRLAAALGLDDLDVETGLMGHSAGKQLSRRDAGPDRPPSQFA